MAYRTAQLIAVSFLIYFALEIIELTDYAKCNGLPGFFLVYDGVECLRICFEVIYARSERYPPGLVSRVGFRCIRSSFSKDLKFGIGTRDFVAARRVF